MKKILALTLALTMVLTLAACGGGNTDPSTEATTEPTEEQTEAPTTEPTEEQTEAPTEEQTEAPTEINAELTGAMGTVEGSVYTNELFGISLQLPEGWSFATAQELALAAGLTENMFDDTAIGALVETGAAPTIMLAMDELGTSNINMNVQKLTEDLSAGLDEYTTMTAELMPALLESSGMTVSNMETKQANFAGESRLGIAYDVEISGVAMSQFIYFLAADDYLATVTFNAPTVEEVDAMVAYFAPIG